LIVLMKANNGTRRDGDDDEDTVGATMTAMTDDLGRKGAIEFF